MDSRDSGQVEPSEELRLLREEVEILRQRVAELRRRDPRHRDDDASRQQGGVAVIVSAREELLLETERLAHVGSWMWDVQTDGVFWSDEMYRILGYDPEHDPPTREGFFARLHPEDRERVEGVAGRATSTGVTEQVEHRLILPDGQVRYVTLDGGVLFDETGKIRSFIGTLRDLTEERALRRKMQTSLELLEEAQRIGKMGNWTYQLSTKSVEWSSGMYRLMGVAPGTPASPDLYLSRLLPEDRARVKALHERSLYGEWTNEYECGFMGPDGEVRRGRLRAIAVRDASGAIVEYRGTLLDITDETRLAERLAQVGKTEAVARLAGGIAHDFNNLLTVISANIELWADSAEDPPELDDARRAIQSAHSLTNRLLALGRRAPLDKRVVDPNELVSRSTELLRRVIGDQVRIVLALGSGIPAICVDPAQIEQALINLVINARDAMPQGGTVTLTTRALERSTGPLVELEVRDDGPGMAPEVKSRIFEPFFTTKGERGTGLGLPTVLGTIEQHGGSVEVESERGKGACFRLQLPAADAALRPKSLAPESADLGRDKDRTEILVVEDDALVAAVIARSLERHGHRPLLAHRPSEALRLWTIHPSIARVICDISMAEMRGPELIALLRQSGREFRVLYVTGYDREGAEDTQGERVLAKPFGPADLLRAVANL